MRNFRFRVELELCGEKQVFFVERQAKQLKEARKDVEWMIDRALTSTAKIVRKID